MNNCAEILEKYGYKSDAAVSDKVLMLNNIFGITVNVIDTLIINSGIWYVGEATDSTNTNMVRTFPCSSNDEAKIMAVEWCENILINNPHKIKLNCHYIDNMSDALIDFAYSIDGDY